MAVDKFFASIGHNLSRIADPSGRESNILFWPYAVLVAGLNYVAGALVAQPMMTAMMEQFVRIFREAGRPGGRVRQFEPTEFMPDLSSLVLPHAIILAVTVVLLFSAVARRLHDRDRSGLLGLIPLPFGIVALALMPYAAGRVIDGKPDQTLFFAAMFNNLLYFGALILLIVLLVGKGTPGPNKYGPAPEG